MFEFNTAEARDAWLQQHSQVISALPPRKASIDQVGAAALAVANADRDALRDSEMPDVPAVVRGSRGGIKGAMLAFGRAFEVEGEAYRLTSFIEETAKRRKYVVIGMRQLEIDALFAAGVFISPSDKRAQAELAERQERIKITLEYGLSAEAHTLATRIVDKHHADKQGRHRQLEIARLLYYTGDLMLRIADWRFGMHLNPHNKVSRQFFTELTGVALPKTKRDTEALFDRPAPAGAQRFRDLRPCFEAVEALVVRFQNYTLSNSTNGGPERLPGQVQNPAFLDHVAEFGEIAYRAIDRYTGWNTDNVLATDIQPKVKALLDVIRLIQAQPWTEEGKQMRIHLGPMMVERARILGAALDDLQAAAVVEAEPEPELEDEDALPSP